MMDGAKETPQSCHLCSALNKEIEKTSLNGETEREAILNFLLSGHRDACPTNSFPLQICQQGPDMASTGKDLYKWEMKMA